MGKRFLIKTKIDLVWSETEYFASSFTRLVWFEKVQFNPLS